MSETNERWWGILSLGLVGAVVALAHRMSRMSTPISPPPRSSPDPSGPTESATSMMKTMMEAMAREREATTSMVMKLLYPMQTVTPSTPPPPFEEQPELTYDYDQTPLSPGIAAVLEREAQEDELLPLMKERAVLQGRVRALQEEEMRLAEEQASSRGPWDNVPGAGG